MDSVIWKVLTVRETQYPQPVRYLIIPIIQAQKLTQPALHLILGFIIVSITVNTAAQEKEDADKFFIFYGIWFFGASIVRKPTNYLPLKNKKMKKLITGILLTIVSAVFATNEKPVK